MAHYVVLFMHFATLLTWAIAGTASDAPNFFGKAVRDLDRVPASVFSRTLPLPAVRQAGEAGDSIDAVVAPLLDSPGSGISVLATVDGEIVKERAYGTADEENDLPMTTSSRTNIGSVTKQFTAFAVLLLEYEGLLSLDDDVRKHIPEMPDYGKTIRLRHMISMTSGIRDVVFAIILSGPSAFDEIPRERLIHLITLQKALRFDPGEQWDYSNSNYVLLALIVERVTGMSFNEVLTKKIFEPLGMNDTTVYDDARKIYPNLTQSYVSVPILRFGEVPAIETYNSKLLLTAIGASGIISTPSDVLKWARNFEDNILGGGQELIDDMQSPYVFPNTSDVTYAQGSQYAKGLFVRNITGVIVYEHIGVIGGFRSILARVPEFNTIIVFQAISDVFDDILGITNDIFLAIFPEVASSGSENSTATGEADESDTLQTDYGTEDAGPSKSASDTANLADAEPGLSSSTVTYAPDPGSRDKGMNEEKMFASLSEAEYKQKAGVWTIKNSTDLYFDLSVDCTDDENFSEACVLKISFGLITEILHPVSDLVWVGRVLGVDRGLTVTFDDSQPTTAVLVLAVPGVEENEARAVRNPTLQLSEEELQRYEGMFFSEELGAVYKSVATNHGLKFGVDAGVMDMATYLPCCSESSFGGSFRQALPSLIPGSSQEDIPVLNLQFEVINGTETVRYSADNFAFPQSNFENIIFRRIESCLL